MYVRVVALWFCSGPLSVWAPGSFAFVASFRGFLRLSAFPAGFYAFIISGAFMGR